MTGSGACVTVLDAFVESSEPEEEVVDPEKVTSVNLVFGFFEHTLQNLKNAQVSLDQKVVIAYNILSGLTFLHNANIIHRDLKPSNILVTNVCNVKIIDFGFARTVTCPFEAEDPQKYKSREMSPTCFTRSYRPPEVILGAKYD